MTTYDYDLIVLGGGSAGLSLSSIASRLGVKVALIDAEDLGGDCLHYGCVPSKAIIKTAKVAHLATNGEKYGVQASDVSVDIQKAMNRLYGIIDTISDHADNAERFRSMGCDVWTHTKGTFVDDHTVNVGEKNITGKKIAICTGTRPSTIPLSGLEETGYLTNETLFSMQTQPKSMIVIGSGPIGCELAQAFSRMGTNVTLANRSDRLLGKEDEDIQQVIRDVFTKEGIQLELGIEMKEVKKKDGQKALVFEKDGKIHEIIAEEILVAVGRTSNADKLSIKNAGVELTDKGYIKTDQKLRTNKKHIYAAGDITGHLQFTHSAGYEAGVVISNAILHIPKKIDLGTIPWATFTDPEVANCGINETTAKEQEIEYTISKMSFEHQDRALAEGDTTGFIKLILGKKDTILGCQIVGSHAGELIHEWIVAMQNGVKLSSLSRLTHVYPTLSGINQQVAGQHLGKKFFTPTVRKWLRLIFGYRNTKIEDFKE